MSKVNLQQTLRQAFNLHQQGLLEPAETLYRVVLAHLPEQADALHFLGLIQHIRGQRIAAREMLLRSVAIKPDVAMYQKNIGLFFAAVGEVDDAVAALRRALQLNPAEPDAAGRLGQLLLAANRPAEAAEVYRAVLRASPGDAGARARLAFSLENAGDFEQAIIEYQNAVAADPKLIMARFNLPMAMLAAGHRDEALRAVESLIAEFPNEPRLRTNLGNVLVAVGRHADAIAAFTASVDLSGGHPDALANLATHQLQLGDVAGSIQTYHRAIAAAPTEPTLLTDLLWAMQHRGDADDAESVSHHRLYDQRFVQPLVGEQVPHDHSPDPHRRLRVGFVSCDFRHHPVAFFFEPMLAALPREKLEITLYNVLAAQDETTGRLKQRADRWRDVASLDPAGLARLVGDDQIDILIDLSGQTGHHRLLTFARKPAPVQMTWLGYPNGSGVSAIDFRITDPIADPAGWNEKNYLETLVRLPDCFACFAPIENAPPISPLPAVTNGHATFASVGRLGKLNETMLQAWKAILDRLPESRLVVIATGLSEPSIERVFVDRLIAVGIDPARVRRVGNLSFDAFLQMHAEFDLVLDTAPFNGHTTTVQSLWMGVPAVTLAGRAHRSRMGASVMQNAGLGEFVIDDFTKYIDRAVALAGDVPKLSAIRSGMRQRLLSSPLMDARTFAGHFESLLRQAWAGWCASRIDSAKTALAGTEGR